MASPENSRNWAKLPRDILSLIYGKLRAVEVLWPAQAVCRPWRQLSLDPQVWRRIDMRNHAGLFNMNDLKKMAMEAVDRSGGHVEEFYGESFVSDELLRYITDRSTGLRCLALLSSYYGPDNEFAEFVGRCPLLEELQIINYTFYSAKTIGAIGRARPELKRFCLNRHWFLRYAVKDNSEAFEISGNMPQLRELQLIGNDMNNVGLMAILDNCCLLESLDIRACYFATIDASLRSRLARIRNVRLPDDSTADYEFTNLIVDNDDPFGMNTDDPFGIDTDDDDDDYDDDGDGVNSHGFWFEDYYLDYDDDYI